MGAAQGGRALFLCIGQDECSAISPMGVQSRARLPTGGPSSALAESAHVTLHAPFRILEL